MFWQNAYAGTIGLPQASTLAHRVDALHDFIFWLSVFFLVLVTAGMLWFVYKYNRHQKGRETAYILGSHTLEAIWTIVPLILMLIIFAWGYKDYLFYRAAPATPVQINVVGRQWLWNFEYPNGRKTMNEVYVPKGREVQFIMTSEDVLHSFSLPNMRTKQDVVPGRYVHMNFEPTLLGEHPIYCTEFCGTGHSDMLGKVIVLEEKDYLTWLETGKAPGTAVGSVAKDQPAKPLAEVGRDLYMAKGCFACHSTDGTRKVGPSLQGIYGHEVELEGGKKATVDENYVRRSLEEPMAEVVKGYPPSMPTFKGLLSDSEINALIAFIKSLK